MPLYEYVCKKCGRIVEALHKVNDPPPECHGPMKKLISKSSFIFKCSGFYATDYKDKPKRPDYITEPPAKKDKPTKDR